MLNDGTRVRDGSGNHFAYGEATRREQNIAADSPTALPDLTV
jgi:hypothetical protein